MERTGRRHPLEAARDGEEEIGWKGHADSMRTMGLGRCESFTSAENLTEVQVR